MTKFYSLIAAAMLLLVVNSAFASSSTFYFKVSATSSNAAEGLVYASEAATDAKDYVATDTVVYSTSATGNSTNHTFHYYAKPTLGNKFVGWTVDPEADSVVFVSQSAHFSSQLTSASTSEAEPATAAFYAVFAEATELFSSRLTAKAIGAEGTVSVSVAHGSETFAAELTDSLIGSGDSLHTYYLQAAVADNQVVRFLGWYADEEHTTRLSQQTGFTYTVNANRPDSVMDFAVYALFEEIPYYLSSVSASAEGRGELKVLTAQNQAADFAASAAAQQRVADRVNHTYYLRAQAEDADWVDFTGWYLGDSLVSDQASFTYTVAAGSEELSYALVAKFAERNPYQFRNASFEHWSNNEPIGWHGPRTAIGSMAGLASGSAPAPAKVADAYTGESAVRLASASVLGVAANGNLTTGIMNMGSMNASATSNNNHTVINDPAHHLIIAGQPDSVVYFAKFSRGDKAQEYAGQVTVYMHDSVENFQDPALESQVPHLMAKAIAVAPESAEWTRCSGAFDYETYAWSFDSVQQSTKFILCDLATNPVAGATAGDTLIVDDIQLVYNSHLDSVLYNGEKLTFADGVAVVDEDYDESLLAYFVGGRGAQVTTAFVPDYNRLMITVKGQDIEYNPENQHVYTLQFPRESFLVTFVDDAEQVLQADSVAYGEMPEFRAEVPSKDATAACVYHFAGWAPELAEVTAEVTYVAQFDSVVNKYLVTFALEDGTVLQADSVAYGILPDYAGAVPSKDATAQYTYTFTGWTPALETVSGEATYVAEFDSVVNKYLVTFALEDGTVLQADSVAYGILPDYAGAVPSKDATAQYTYTFTGWTPALETVSGEATYVAEFEAVVNKYLVTFALEDGTVLQADSVAYGELPVFLGENPVKEEDEEFTYSFSGWTPELTAVVADATYTASFLATEKPKSAVENVELEKGVKIMEDGVVYILRGGLRYTISGQLVR